jgi:hypothetical protein
MVMWDKMGPHSQMLANLCWFWKYLHPPGKNNGVQKNYRARTSNIFIHKVESCSASQQTFVDSEKTMFTLKDKVLHINYIARTSSIFIHKKKSYSASQNNNLCTSTHTNVINNWPKKPKLVHKVLVNRNFHMTTNYATIFQQRSF